MLNDPFFDAIMADPDDAGLRLVYADWLEERGDARGEMLQVLHEMARTPVRSVKYRNLWVRREQLRGDLSVEWVMAVFRPSFAQFRTKIELLIQLDTDPDAVDYEPSRYDPNPPLSIDRIEEIESRIGVRLPEEYRRFASEIGDGGGVFFLRPLESSLAGDNLSINWETRLSIPFVPPKSAAELKRLKRDSVRGVLPVFEFMARARGGDYLVISGSERCNIWQEVGDGENWTPAVFYGSLVTDGPEEGLDERLEQALRSPRVRFLDWFATQLDQALAGFCYES